jgi:hypothetical protein
MCRGQYNACTAYGWYTNSNMFVDAWHRNDQVGAHVSIVVDATNQGVVMGEDKRGHTAA